MHSEATDDTSLGLMSLGLTNSDVDYLKQQNPQLIDITSANDNLIQTPGLVQLTSENNLNAEAALMQHLQIPSDLGCSVPLKLPEQNHFVQVSSESTVGLVALNGTSDAQNGQNIALVSIPQILSNTDFNTITATATEGLTQEMLQAAHFLPKVGGDGLQLTNISSVPSFTDISQVQVLNGNGTTSAVPDLYVLQMKLEDVQQEEKKEKVSEIIEENIGDFNEPRRTSTPTNTDPERVTLDETIIAGNIDSKNYDNKVNEDEEVDVMKISQDEKNSEKTDDKEVDVNEKKLQKSQGILPKLTEEKMVKNPVILPVPEEKMVENPVVKKKVSRCLTYNTQAERSHVRKIELNEKNETAEERAVSSDGEVHNKSYCRKWIENLQTTGNLDISTAQSDANFDGEKSVSNTLLDVTSVSRNVQGYRVKSKPHQKQGIPCKDTKTTKIESGSKM